MSSRRQSCGAEQDAAALGDDLVGEQERGKASARRATTHGGALRRTTSTRRITSICPDPISQSPRQGRSASAPPWWNPGGFICPAFIFGPV